MKMKIVYMPCLDNTSRELAIFKSLAIANMLLRFTCNDIAEAFEDTAGLAVISRIAELAVEDSTSFGTMV
tara:strand:- start:1214 stop:1423 length:210 start_codon:yes stop_codon:yes gene_type:complete